MPSIWRPNRFRILSVARDFTVSNSYVSYSGRAISNGANDNSGEWAVMVWAIATSTGQMTPIAQAGNSGSTRECGIFLDGNQTLSIVSGLSPTYHVNLGSAATFQTNRWECFFATGTSSGWATYTRSSNAYVFNSTGDQRITPSGSGVFAIGTLPDISSSFNWQGRIGIGAAWGAFLSEAEAKKLGAGAAPWQVRRSALRRVWQPRTRAGPDLDLVGNTYGTLQGSPTLAPFPWRGFIKP